MGETTKGNGTEMSERDPVHLMTIEMGSWCGATGPRFNGRASSAWREVTCAECHARRTAWFLALVRDMLQAMPASSEALAFAVRAGRLGVTDEHGRPLAMACVVDAEDDGPFYVEADATPPHPPLRGPDFPTLAELGGEKLADWPTP